MPRSGIRQLPITAKHLGAVEDLPRLHNDPFDRVLVSQARLETMAIVTLDSHITQYDIDVVW